MIVICEECGKKYRTDPSRIKGRAASFKCHGCGHVIVVAKPRPASPKTPLRPERKSMPATTVDDPMEAGTEEAVPASGKRTAKTRRQTGAGGVGLRPKMLLLFLFIPIALMTGAGLFYLWQFDSTSRLLVGESADIVTQLAEEKGGDPAGNIENLAGRVNLMQSRTKVLIDRTRTFALGILGATLLITGIIIFAYVQRLTGKIKALTEVAERISLGELDLEVDTRSGDEIGDLAEAIARMQKNIRLSIERLQRR